MYPKYGKAISLALSALIATSAPYPSVLAEELAEPGLTHVAANPAEETLPEVSFVLHPTASVAINVADTLESLLEREEAARARGIDPRADVATAGFDGMLLGASGLEGISYRLFDGEGNPGRWAQDGGVAKVVGAARGVQIELGDKAGDLVLYVAACVHTQDGTTTWTPFVSTGTGALIKAGEGEFIVDLDVSIRKVGDGAPASRVKAPEVSVAAEACEPGAQLVPDEASMGLPTGVHEEQALLDEPALTVQAQEALSQDVLPQEDIEPQVPEAAVAQESPYVPQVVEEPALVEEVTPASEEAASVPSTVLNENPIYAASAEWARLGGSDRFETAALITQCGFAASHYAVLTCGRNFPDALSAVSLAGRLECPVLICEQDGLPPSTVAEIMDLGVQEIYVVGGTSAVSDAVVADLEREGVTTHRLFGLDRMETSLSVFREMCAQGPVGTVIIASGQSFADALSISPWAWTTKTPILLCDASGTLTSEQIAALAEQGVPNAIIVGGTSAVTGQVEEDLSFMNVGRISGKDRYETSAEIARFEAGSGHSWQIPYVATGKSFPDSLTGSALVGSTNSILVLADEPGQVTLELLAEHAAEMDHGVILGGKDAVPFDDPLAVHEKLQATGKVGYQNPEGFYQVSSNNVTITDAARPPFDYITPSRIAADATREDCVNAFLERAAEYIGTPYVWDYACAPGVGVDCIGLVFQCAYACGMDLGGGVGDFDFNPWAHYSTGASGWHSHDSNNFWDYGSAMHVPLSDRRPGDLINYPGHTAIYLGDDEIIHAYTGQGVVYANMYDPGMPRGCIRLFQ